MLKTTLWWGGLKRPLVCSGLVLAAMTASQVQASDLAVSCQHAPAITDYDKAMVAELNRIRTDPVGFAADVRRYYASLTNGREYVRNGVRMQMTEGRPAVDEALAYLMRASPVAPVDLATCLSAAAGDHASDQSHRGGIGHTGSDGSDPSTRAGRYLSGKAYCGENIAYGDHTPFEVVMQLAVDDGVPNRGHRTNLFDERYLTVGFGHASHPEYKGVDVMLLCMNSIANNSGHDYVAPDNDDSSMPVTGPVTAPVATPAPAPVTTPGKNQPEKSQPEKPRSAKPVEQETGSSDNDGRTLLESNSHSTEEKYERDGVNYTVITTVETRRYSDGTEEEETTVETTQEWTEEVKE